MLAADATCFDFVAFDEELISEYLTDEEDVAHDKIVLVFHIPASGSERGPGRINTTCSRFSQLRAYANDATNIFMPCTKRSTNARTGEEFYPLVVDSKTRVLKLPSSNFGQFFVPMYDIRRMLQAPPVGHNRHRIFLVSQTSMKFERTASAGVVLQTSGNAAVSADHCQAGTAKFISRVRPLTSQDRAFLNSF